MISLQEAASGLLNAVESAIESGGWKVDGACDPSVEIIRLKNALAKPQKEWVGLTDEEIQAERHKLDQTAGWTYDHFARAIESKLKQKNVPQP